MNTLFDLIQARTPALQTFVIDLLQNRTLHFYALLAIAVLFEVTGDLLFRKWGIEQRWPLFVISLVVYNMAVVAWACSLRITQVSSAIMMLGVLNVILVVIGGVVLFKEKLSAPQILGLLLGVASLALLHREV